ncbi:MAG TPA: DUF6702 family protein [Gemmatimonadales bacterium]|jgi:hypothetical protein
MLALALAVVLLGAPVASSWPAAHPIHTALTELSYDGDTGTVAIRIRVFVDDLMASLASMGEDVSADSVLSRYVRGRFALVDRSGRPAPLRWRGTARAGDTITLELQAALPGGLERARVLNAVLCERFQDQVNIVRALYDGRAITLLFTRGDTAKPLS